MSPAELEEALRAADPSVFLVAPRILRRVIKQDAGVSGIGLRVPHRKTYVIRRDRLLAIVDRDELDAQPDVELPEHAILMARPTSEMLRNLTPEEALVKYWRQLFHARVHLAIEEQMAAGQLGEADIRARIQQIGTTQFEEIRSVLRQEEYLLPPKSDAVVYVEFVAVYLELRYFMPSFLRSYFPSLDDYHGTDALLMRDGGLDFRTGDPIEAQALFEAQIDIHHIFPRDWCKKQGIPEKVFNSIVNKAPLSKRSNIIIGGRAPSEYLQRIEEQQKMDPESLDKILRTHLIDPEHLRNDDFEAFFEARQNALASLVADAMGKAVVEDQGTNEQEEDADPEVEDVELEEVA